MFYYKVKNRCVWIILAFSNVVDKICSKYFYFIFYLQPIPYISKCPFVSLI
jgi:hypothetical protein